MSTITIHETRAAYVVPFDEAALADGPVILERKGRRVAVIVPADEFQAFRLWQESRSWPQRQLDRLQAERTAFRRLLPELFKTHPNQFVAIRDGRLVDADADETALARRMLVLGHRPVYIQEVRAEPRIYDLPSPEVVRHVSL